MDNRVLRSIKMRKLAMKVNIRKHTKARWLKQYIRLENRVIKEVIDY